MRCVTLACLLSFSVALSAKLTVHITGVDASKPGELVVHLWNDPKGFPKGKYAFATLKAAADRAETFVLFTNLEPGAYAASVFHDANTNGKLDFKLLFIPAEGAGFSGEKTPMGPPPFRDYKFTLGAGGGETRVKLKY